ncbi:hypothetical protein ACFW96_33820, partial [Streptomyces gardneri]
PPRVECIAATNGLLLAPIDTGAVALVRPDEIRYCDFNVPVEPVLVFVGVERLQRAATQYSVRVYQERDVAAFGPLAGKLTPEQVESVYAVARHPRAWLRT